MNNLFPILFALGIGFAHAFEADHLLAISNIVTKRNKPSLALKDGIFWGLGHTSTILGMGLLIILGKLMIEASLFAWFEGLVGLTLITLGTFRIFQLFHQEAPSTAKEGHKLAYGVGLIHGLAGSGAIILIAMTEIQSWFKELFYLLSFGIGSILGMLVAAGLFSLPFSQPFRSIGFFRQAFIAFSGLLCIGYGAFMLKDLF